MKARFSKSVIITITFFLIISISISSVAPARAETPASKGASAQLQSSGPYGPEGQPLTEVAAVVMPAVDTEKLLQEDQQRTWDTPPRFATPINVQMNPATDGTWETLPNGLQLWRLRIVSPDAVSLNVGFTTYNMPPGGQLYLYTPDYGQVVGPFTEKDNEDHGQLWTPIVEGAEVVVEVSLPASETSQLQLELTSVNHGYVDFQTAEKSGSCNVDVVCSQGDSWRSQISSVGRYTFSGGFLCTGALINNTAQDFKPYFLTANHCLNTSGEAASVVVYWNYECPTCRAINSAENGTPISTAGFPTQSGAFLRATYAPSDMTLLELDDAVSPSVNPFWSGWDRSGANASSAVAIHHPQGHEKRISFENNATTITSYGGTSVPGDGTHIRITDWDLGTTEGGSSGSPLFDQNMRIIGQLHGGAAACGNNSSDWYGRLFASWTGGGTNATRLSNWLDPASTGAVTINGLSAGSSGDAYEPDNSSGLAKVINSGDEQTHSIVPATDVDWVKFTLNATSAVRLETSGGTPADTRMWLYNSSLTQLDFSDDDGGGSYSLITRTCAADALPAGTYYVKVDDFANDSEISSYEISFDITQTCPIPLARDSTGVFRPSNGALYLKNTNATGFADVQINYGLPGDYPVVGDWDGNGTDTIGIYRNGWFYLRNSNTIGFADIVFPFGAPGDQPIAGDWNNDGIDTVGVYHSASGTFYLRYENSMGLANVIFSLGIPGDVGIAGDWNGDGIDTTGVFRPSNGALYLKNTNATGFADIQINYGLPGDKPVTGDWNNDGIDTIGIYRNGSFYLRNSNTVGFADLVFALGVPGDHPIAGDWDAEP